MKEVGSLLKETRESQGLDIKQAAEALNVRAEYLEILESGDLSSVSNEIYITGYLKSYATWLGLNSNEVTKQFKSFNKDLSVTKNASPDSSSFINIEERFLSSHKMVYLLCAVMLLSFLIISSNADKKISFVDFMEGAVSGKYPFGEHPYAGFAYKADVNGKIILMAKDDIDIRLNYNDNFIEKEYLASGEVYFLPSNKDVLISSQDPENIDVFSDEGAGEYLGTLKDFYIFN